MRMIQARDYCSYFDETNGGYMRTGILKDGRDTGVDPFMGEFPELFGCRNHGALHPWEERSL